MTRLGIAYTLLLALGPIVARGADLPEFSAADVCSAAAMPGCWGAQTQTKERLQHWMSFGDRVMGAPDRGLLTYCIADAAYRLPGYVGIFVCVERERWEQQLRAVDKAHPGGSSIGAINLSCGDDNRCVVEEIVSSLNLHIGEHDPLPADIFNGCLGAAKGSYVLFDSCVRLALKSDAARH